MSALRQPKPFPHEIPVGPRRKPPEWGRIDWRSIDGVTARLDGVYQFWVRAVEQELCAYFDIVEHAEALHVSGQSCSSALGNWLLSLKCSSAPLDLRKQGLVKHLAEQHTATLSYHSFPAQTHNCRGSQIGLRLSSR